MSPATIGFLLGFLLDPPVPVPQASVPPPPTPVAAATDVVDYPLGPMALPDLGAPGEPFKLVDLSYDVSDTDRTTHAFAARVKVRDRGYLGASFEGERREIAWTSQRLELTAAGEEGVYDLFGSYRAPRFIVSTGARDRRPRRGKRLALPPGAEREALAGARGRGVGRRQHPKARRPLPPRHRARLRLAARGGLRGRGRDRANPRDGRGRLREHARPGRPVGGRPGGRRRARRRGLAGGRGGPLSAAGGGRLRAGPGPARRASPRRGRGARPLRAGRRAPGPRVPRGPHVVRPALLLPEVGRGRGAGAGPRSPGDEARRQRAHRLHRGRPPRAAGAALPLPRPGGAARGRDRPPPRAGRGAGGSPPRPRARRRRRRPPRCRLRGPCARLRRPAVAPGVALAGERGGGAVPAPRPVAAAARRAGSASRRSPGRRPSRSPSTGRWTSCCRWSRADPTALDIIRGVGRRRTIELAYVYAFGR